MDAMILVELVIFLNSNSAAVKSFRVKRGLKQGVCRVCALSTILIELWVMTSQITKFMWPTWGPPGSYRPQLDPTLAPWTMLAGIISSWALWRLILSPLRLNFQNFIKARLDLTNYALTHVWICCIYRSENKHQYNMTKHFVKFRVLELMNI